MSTFELALAEVLRWEGGYVNDPRDHGGATNRGITQATYDEWRRSKGLPLQPVTEIGEEEVRAIYRERYWVPVAAFWDAAGHPGIALYLFDIAVQHGVGTARAFEHRLADVLRLHPLLGLAYLHRDRTLFYTRVRSRKTGKLLFPDYGRGWMRRVSHIYARAVELEHPGGLIRAQRFFLDGHEYPLAAARWVGEKLYVRRA